jgi:hypothetical protein
MDPAIGQPADAGDPILAMASPGQPAFTPAHARLPRVNAQPGCSTKMNRLAERSG